MNGDGSGAKDGGDDDSAETGAKSKKTKTHLSKKEKKELDRLESEEIARAEQRVLVSTSKHCIRIFITPLQFFSLCIFHCCFYFH